MNNRRKFIGTAAALAAGTLAATAMPIKIMKSKTPVVHHVFFWLKNPESKADKDKLIAGIKALKKIETVKDIHVGVVASTEKRDVVDTSWSVSELIFFTDVEGQAVYQDHPLHLEFIKNCSSLWEKVVVYDAIDA
ncbi:MAG: Dabb family protein [Pedobacter sp.]